MQILIFKDDVNANAYLFYDEDTKDATLIDVGAPAEVYLKAIEEQGLNLKKILLTHGHFDHIAGLEELREKTGAKVYAPEKDADFLTNAGLNLSSVTGGPVLEFKPADVLVKEGDEIEIGPGTTLKAIETPGHTPGSISYVGDGFVVVGDVLFEGSIGRTDFPGGSYDQIMKSIDRLIELGDDTIVMPGHGNLTRIGIEKEHNPFLA